MRRRPGIAGIHGTQAMENQFKALGEQVQQTKIEHMKTQMATFKTSLEQFAAKHRDDIRRDPAFRQQFHIMCTNIGVDPLVSNKGTWNKLLGLGDFYYEIAVQVIEVCLLTRPFTGGWLDLSLVLKGVQRRRGSAADPITKDDIKRAIEKLRALGSGIGIVKVGSGMSKREMVRSVPSELSTDGNALVDLAGRQGGYFTRGDIASILKWREERTNEALLGLCREGLVLVDDPPDGSSRLYWVPAVGMDNAVRQYQEKCGLNVTGIGL